MRLLLLACVALSHYSVARGQSEGAVQFPGSSRSVGVVDRSGGGNGVDDGIQVQAAAPSLTWRDCECQCINRSFRSRGVTHGNCRT